MSSESEYTLENRMIERLVSAGYEYVKIHDEKAMHSNLKKQLEKHNNKTFSDQEFKRILIHINSSSVFESAKKLRDKYELQKDDNTYEYIELFDSQAWCKNEYQVTNQVTMVGKRTNRYDVTILINGLPLVQIELKKRGVELKQAFHQIDRYHRDSYSGLFTYTQIFIISNGVNTKYFSNSKGQPYSNTFNWTDEKNNKINDLEKFTEIFLEKCHISKMIAKYTVLHETTKKIMVLRPYQYYATEKIISQVINNPDKNGYIWHTTGSGKTLTSFKTSQILSTMDKIDKIMFVVDRKDLDYQTIKEFKAFSKDSVEDTKNTRNLEQQLSDDKIPLVVTTIQKLNNAISKERYQNRMQRLRDKHFVIIFDECHRTQFGDTHKKINDFFTNKQFFGFTGTPIFKDNNIKGRTTKELFGDCLHRYLIKDAIDDENVLDFSVEYISTFNSKSLLTEDADIDVDDFDKVVGIDKKAVFNSSERLELVTNHIIEIHSRKTYQREYTAIFAVSGVKIAIQYYDIFKEKNTDLNIATIFTYNPNEAQDYSGDMDDEEKLSQDTRSKLENIVTDFNKTFGTNHNLNKENGFNAYYVDVSKKVKEKKIDILIVVNMFLTGFDSKPLNTLYVDKNLRYHGLIQAYSRTNRIYDEKKKHGNIVCFRNLKKRTDEAITLFSDESAIETVIKKSYSFYVNILNELIYELLRQAPRVQDVDRLQGDEEVEFVKSFRDILRTLNTIETFREFTYDDLDMSEQTIENYKGKYLDLYEKVRNGKLDPEKESILDDISFEIELIRRDHINVQYIIELLTHLDKDSSSYEIDKNHIYKIIDSNERLRSKKELIKKFIEENLIEANDTTDIEAEFHTFMDIEKLKEIQEYANNENLSPERIIGVLTYYEFTNRIDHSKIKELSKESLKFLDKKKRMPMWEAFIENIIEKYEW